ncbi:MAG: ribosome maturation factor RimP [Gammaproteobacteria bacterium]|jgi:ribosome maturation factor RimP
MSVEQQRFYELLAPSIESVGCELLGVQISRGRQHTVLRLYIDKLVGGDEATDNDAGSDTRAIAGQADQERSSDDGGGEVDVTTGVTIEDCTRVSRQVSGVLDVEDPIEGEYSLEVSSPGDDRPLFRLAHYVRFIGHLIRARLVVPVDGRRSVTGRIVSIEDDMVVIQEEKELWRLSMEQIALSRLIPEV